MVTWSRGRVGVSDFVWGPRNFTVRTFFRFTCSSFV